MKFKDIQIGQTVEDELGNEYKVCLIDEFDKEGLHIMLRCIKLIKPIAVDNNADFTSAGDSLWIYKSKKDARKNGCRKNNIVTVKSLKVKEIK